MIDFGQYIDTRMENSVHLRGKCGIPIAFTDGIKC